MAANSIILPSLKPVGGKSASNDPLNIWNIYLLTLVWSGGKTTRNISFNIQRVPEGGKWFLRDRPKINSVRVWIVRVFI